MTTTSSLELDEFFASLEQRTKGGGDDANICKEASDSAAAALAKWTRRWQEGLNRLGVEVRDLEGLGEEHQRRQDEMRELRDKADAVKADLARMERQIEGANEEKARRRRSLEEKRRRLEETREGMQGKKDKLREYCHKCRDLLGIDVLTSTKDTIVLQMDKLVR